MILNNNPNVIEHKEMLQAKELLKTPIMILYHGNKNADIIPSFGKGRKHNDYGQGFYATPDPELGKEWAWGTYTKGDKGYLHGYEIDTSGLKILNLTEVDSLHWVAELYANRTLNLDGREALRDTKEAFGRLKKISFEEGPPIYAERYRKRDKNAELEYNRIKISQVSRKKETIHKFI